MRHSDAKSVRERISMRKANLQISNSFDRCAQKKVRMSEKEGEQQRKQKRVEERGSHTCVVVLKAAAAAWRCQNMPPTPLSRRSFGRAAVKSRWSVQPELPAELLSADAATEVVKQTDTDALTHRNTHTQKHTETHTHTHTHTKRYTHTHKHQHAHRHQAQVLPGHTATRPSPTPCAHKLEAESRVVVPPFAPCRSPALLPVDA